MSDDWTAQAHICPICIDDHSPDRLCKRRDLIERIERLEAIVRRIASDDVRDRRGIIPDAKALIGLPHSERNSAS
jgi:alkylhydroperoxidase family enzyme